MDESHACTCSRGSNARSARRRALRAGYWLLRVLDALAPGAVDWRAAHRPPLRPLLRRPQSIENCNQVRRGARRARRRVIAWSLRWRRSRTARPSEAAGLLAEINARDPKRFACQLDSLGRSA